MNEPQIYDTPTKTMPVDMIHFKTNGRAFEHKVLHNAYGAFHQRSSYRGLLARDNHEKRPFVLTRSFFMGSQKFGAYWSGDNYSVNSELHGCVNQLLGVSIAGHPFGGCDVPGFKSEQDDDVPPTDDLFI